MGLNKVQIPLTPLLYWSLPTHDTAGVLIALISMIEFFSVIPAKAGHEVKRQRYPGVSSAAWIPGLRSAPPGMTANWNMSP